jgi:hypothetical protein
MFYEKEKGTNVKYTPERSLLDLPVDLTRGGTFDVAACSSLWQKRESVAMSTPREMTDV